MSNQRAFRRRRSSVDGAAAFNPLSVSGCLVWYDLGVCTQGAGIVTALPDQSGNARNATITGGSEPSYTATNAGFGNLPTMDFPATDTKHVIAPSLGLTTGAVTFVVVGNSNPGGGASGYIFSASNALAEVYYADGILQTRGSNDDGTTNLDGDATSSPSVIVYIANGASSKLYVSKRTAVTGNAGAQDLTAATITIGSYGPFVSTLFSQTGSTAHFLAYSGAMAQADVETLLTGFGALAGITIGA